MDESLMKLSRIGAPYRGHPTVCQDNDKHTGKGFLTYVPAGAVIHRARMLSGMNIGVKGV